VNAGYLFAQSVVPQAMLSADGVFFALINGNMMNDERCCGTGTCIINAEGYCWCGQKWDGEKMCFPVEASAPETLEAKEAVDSNPIHQRS
jgi:hypothetical protein